MNIPKSGMTNVMPLFEPSPEAHVSESAIPVCGHKIESFACFFAEKITKISRQKIASPSHTDAEWFWKGARWM
ncbi:hypothetical protein [Pseudoflavonifractor phocaeensis]|uniref:hypothetical protein n=1 Tax=Pseudoflavonifractor phocaeensis TaxID=1870988 RepID=UPI001F278837|nr:hypothetical protein [Pseudoflavonifractor phocaeensis]MCF2596577.1 hypothetical protein [Pseudoflavonifractor phocaeensis]